MFHIFSILLQGPGYYAFLCFLSVLLIGPTGQQNPKICRFSLFFLLLYGVVVWLRLGDPFVFQNPRRGLSVSFSRTDSRFTYTICSYGQTSIPCTISSELLCPPSLCQVFLSESNCCSHVQFCCTLSILVLI